eukprot:Hpha_TRINITY_DN6393_c0_g1::TRINITY_DN6393_c0_g1_i1::g.145552::m.145552
MEAYEVTSAGVPIFTPPTGVPTSRYIRATEAEILSGKATERAAARLAELDTRARGRREKLAQLREASAAGLRGRGERLLAGAEKVNRGMEELNEATTADRTELRQSAFEHGSEECVANVRLSRTTARVESCGDLLSRQTAFLEDIVVENFCGAQLTQRLSGEVGPLEATAREAEVKGAEVERLLLRREDALEAGLAEVARLKARTADLLDQYHAKVPQIASEREDWDIMCNQRYTECAELLSRLREGRGLRRIRFHPLPSRS